MKKPWFGIGFVFCLPLLISFAESQAASKPLIVPSISEVDTSGLQASVPTPGVAPTAQSQIASAPALQLPNTPPVTIASQDVSNTLPPPINMISGIEAPLDAKEARAVKLANAWKGRHELPTRGQDGSVEYLYGATLPTVVCAPLYECVLKLQPGESVTSLNVADPRWIVTPGLVGTGASQTTLLVIKPKDSGLMTDLTISTDRRFYVVKLLSRTKDWTPVVSFSYPEDAAAAWAAYYAKTQAQHAATIIPNTGQNVAKLDFGFRLSGDSVNWRPTRVYTDGTKTYIQFPPSVKSSDIPALVLIGNNKSEQLVNYRMVGNAYVVDDVISQAALISGVGRYQTKVTITRDSGAN